MDEIEKQAAELLKNIDIAFKKLDLNERQIELEELRELIAEPDFWQDNLKAQEVTKRLAKIKDQIEPWVKLKNDVQEIVELAKEDDQTIKQELKQQLVSAQTDYKKLQFTLQFSGKYDDRDAILRLSAGAGGTDAQDWTQMLERMYLRWGEHSGMKTELIEESPGEEAGLKSATISVSGPYAYGKLKGEHGVHRLVRLSPFNSDNLRQTSFALVEVLPQIDTPEEVHIDDSDLRIDVYRSGGKGGQSVNTTDSAVRVTHIPTGIVVAIQNERSQLQNKDTALKILRSKLAQLQIEQHNKKLNELKGPTKSAEWGAQIRNYVLHPYTLVKDTRNGHEERDAQKVLDGEIDGFIEAYLNLG
ncbi:MAG TPA: peptide chain release factor 2 [Candidatus Saccharimonadales bacterium]|nr:peptide chain release factor 2 [Candidatus Saccharimonadales bacterium]